MDERASVEPLERRLLLSVDAGLVAFTQVAGDSSAIVLQYDMPALQMKPVGDLVADGQVFLPVLGSAPTLAAPDRPALPVVSRQIVLPYGYELAGVSVVTGSRITLDGTYLLQQGQTPVFFEPDTAPVSADPLPYTGGSFIPQPFEIVSIQRSRGVSILTVNLNPVSYQADTRIVSYVSSMTLSVDLTEADMSTDSGAWRVSYRSDDILPLAGQVDNPGALAGYAVTGGATAAGGAGLADPADTYDYVLITGQAMVGSAADYTVGDFVAFKQSQGFAATIVTVEDIYATYAGVDPQEQIRAFILDAYNSWQTDYVLLAGDTNIIPAREVYVQHPYWEIDDERGLIPTDLYYQCLDGDFNFDGDDKYGEPNDGIDGGEVDMLAEVFIGRASAENEAEMANWIAKNIAHQSNTSGEYRWRAAMVGEWMGHTGIGNWGKYKMEELRTGADTHGYSTDGFASDPRFISQYPDDTLYERDLNDKDEPDEGDAITQWQVADLLAMMNSDAYGIYNHAGHGMVSRVMKIVGRDAVSLFNDNPFFIYSGSCHPGNFTKSSIGEELTTTTRNAAYAVVMNSSFGWSYRYSTTEGPSQHLFREFWDALFNEELTELGVMNADSHADSIGYAGMFAYRWVIYATTLLGDPATSMVSSQFALGTFVDPIKAYVGQAFDFALHARNGAGGYRWAVAAGSLPAGMSLDADTGVITGVSAAMGDWAFTVAVTDQSGATVEADYVLSVVTPLEIVTATPGPAEIAVPYSSAVQFVGGTGPYAWTLLGGSLPNGLSLDAATGVISGTPQEYGAFDFTLHVQDSAAAWQATSADLTLVVAWPATEIHGQVFEDVDYDAVRDPGEAGLDGWTVELVDRFTRQVVATTVAASVDVDGDGAIDPLSESGLYSFTGIAEGKYELRQVSQAGSSGTARWADARTFALRDNGGIGAAELDIYEIDVADGGVLNSFPVPAGISDILSQGLATGPDSLFYIDGSDTTTQAVLWELDLDTGAVIDSDIVDAAVPMTISGLGYLDGKVYIQYQFDEILVWDPFRDRIVDTLTVAGPILGGLTGRADLGVLLAATAGGDVVAIDPASGAILDMLSPGAGMLSGGLTYDYRNGHIIACALNDPNSTAYRIDPASGAVVSTLTIEGQGAISGLAGDVPAAVTNTYYLDVRWTDILTGRDFGNVEAVTISGRVFHDADGDGASDADEPGLHGWTVELVDAATGDVVASTTTTRVDIDGDGSIDPHGEAGLYSFQNVLPGGYELRQVARVDYSLTHPVGGSYLLTVAAGDSVVGADFGNAADAGQVSGQVYHDGDFSGSRGPGEAGLDGWTVELVDAVTHEVIATAVTFSDDLDSSGAIDPQTESGLYALTGVLPGAYELQAAAPGPWWRPTEPSAGFDEFTLAGGQDILGRDIGLGQWCYVAGAVFSDVDGDGTRDAGETGLNGWTVELLDAATGLTVAVAETRQSDLNGDGAIDPATESGLYYFTPAPGSYEVRLVAQADWLQTDPAGSHAATLAAGQQATGLDFANNEFATISGAVFYDYQTDGQRVYWETGLDDRTVELVDAATGQVVATAVTAEQDLDDDGEINPTFEAGLFAFTGVLPGEYGLRLVGQAGWLPTTPAGETFALSIAAGDEVAELYFGSVELNVIAGQVYDDLNGDGCRQAGEPAIEGWTVELVDRATGQVVAAAVTGQVDLDGDGAIDPLGETGAYRFADMHAGSYEVRRVGRAGWRQTSPNTGQRVFALRKDSIVDISICEFDPATGVMRNSFPAPAQTVFGLFQGLAVGPTSLFYVDSAGPDRSAVLWELDADTGSVLASHAIVATGSNVAGLAYLDGKVYLQYPNEILVWDTTVNAVIDSFALTYPMTGLTGAADLGVLLALADGGRIISIDPVDGSVLGATAIAEQLPYAGGVAYHDGKLLIAPYIDAARRVYLVDPASGAVLDSYSMPYSEDIVGLGGEGGAGGYPVTLQFELQWGVTATGQDFGVQAGGVLGDFNADGVVDAADIDMLYGNFAPAGQADPGFDLDGDGDADASDVAVLVHDVLNTEFGDANLDGVVNTTDLTCLATNFGLAGGWASGDFTGEGTVNTADLAVVAANFGFIAAPPPATASPTIAQSDADAATTVAADGETDDELVGEADEAPGEDANIGSARTAALETTPAVTVSADAGPALPAAPGPAEQFTTVAAQPTPAATGSAHGRRSRRARHDRPRRRLFAHRADRRAVRRLTARWADHRATGQVPAPGSALETDLVDVLAEVEGRLLLTV